MTSENTELVNENATRPDKWRAQWEGIERHAQAEMGDDAWTLPASHYADAQPGEAMLRLERKIRSLWFRAVGGDIKAPKSVMAELAGAVDRWETDFIAAVQDLNLARANLKKLIP